MKFTTMLLTVCLTLLVICVTAFGAVCPPGSTPPHPLIVSSFLPDSSCVDKHQPDAGTAGKPCLVACENQFATYCIAPINVGSSYVWTVVGGAISSGQGTSCVTVLWGPSGNGNINVVETNIDSCTGSDDRCVKIITSPIAMFTANTNVCKNVPVNFINNSVNALTYYWDFGDGNNSTLMNPTHAYANGGTYTVILVAYNKCGCSDSTSLVINVSSTPGPVIDCPTTVCEFTEACYSTSSGCPGAVYHWIVNGGTIVGPSNTASICIQWGAGPQGTIGLYITGCGNVCADTTTVVIPIISSTASISGPTVVCVNSTSIYGLPLWPGTYYNWQVLLNGTIIGGWNTNSIQVQWPSFPGNAIIIADWHNILLGCGGTDTIHVKIRDELVINNLPGPFCIGDITTFTANGNCNWIVTGGNILGGNGTSSIQVSWTSGGIHTVTATPLNPNLFCNPNATSTITVVTVPQALSITGPQTVCPGGTYSYLAAASGPGYTFQWSVLGGSIIGSPNANPVTVQWGGPGTISVSQVQTVAPFCSSLPITIPVGIFTIPSIAGPTVVCMDGNATFTAGPPNPGINYVWTIEDGLNNPSPKGSITSGQGTNSINVLWHGPGGTAVVKLTVCSTVLTQSVTINPKPNPVITMTGAVCDPGGTVNLTVSPAFASYSWTGGGATQSINVTSSGQYCVTVTDANGCQASVCIDVPHTPPPTASISSPGPLSYCSTPPPTINTPIIALAGPNYQYFWVPTGQTTPTITATAAGSYYVVVTDAVTGCKSTSNVITITTAPCVGGGPGCTPQAYSLSFNWGNVGGLCNNLQFNAVTSNVTNLGWSFGDGGTAGNVPNPTHVYNQAAVYSVTLCGDVPSTTTGTCHVCSTMVVQVPVAANFMFVNVCGKVTFTDISTWLPSTSITSWSWGFPGGSPSSWPSQVPPPVTYPTSGSYPVTLTVSNGGCSSTITINVPVTTPPSPLFSLAPTACVGTPVPMAAGAAFSWHWDFGDAATSGTQTTSHAWATPGTYIVKLVVKSPTGCADSSTQSITITSPAGTCPLSPANPAPICQGDSVKLTAAPGASYIWLRNNVVIPGALSQVYYAKVTGSYTVKVTDAGGCVCISPPVIVVVNPLPPNILSVTGSPIICGSGLITLTAPAGPYSYLWSDASTNQSLTVFLNTPGIYTYYVIITDNATGCFDTSAVYTVNVYGAPVPPTITAGGPTIFCKGGSVTLTSSSAVNNLWNTGATTQNITVSASGTYSVTVTDPNGCQATAFINVTVSPLPDFSLFPIGCDLLCDTVKIPGPIGPYPGYYTYQWLFNGVPIPPANGVNDTLTPVGNGTYSLILTGPGPTFCIDTSNGYNLSLKDCDSVHCNGKICGRKWNDANGNHKFNYGTEHGIFGWKICLVRCNIDGYPTKDTLACTTTDSLGFYCFTGLCKGDYCVVEVPRPGWSQTWPIAPKFYHVSIGDSTTLNGIDFGNKYKCIDIWVTADTIGVPIDPILTPSVMPSPSIPWPVEIKYRSAPSAAFTTVFNGIIGIPVDPIVLCPPGTYHIIRHHLANYKFDRIYVNDTLWTNNQDSVSVEVADSLQGVSILFLNTANPDTTVKFRTFTASQLAGSDQVKPVKRTKPGKPVVMPNTANVIDEILRQQGIILVGLPSQMNAAQKEKAYLNPKKQADVFKTFNDKDVVHTGDPRGLALDAKGKVILKRQTKMSPVKHNNVFLANLLALKLNILASDLGKTPPGLGDLVYVPPVGSSPWFVTGPECTVAMIAAAGDDILTNWEGVSYQKYYELNELIAAINASFAGSVPIAPEDTLSWITGPKLRLNGARALSDVPFLIQVSGTTPIARPVQPKIDLGPDRFMLEQNYPNPFNPSTVIRFSMPEDAYITLKVYNVLGQEVRTFFDNAFLDAGDQEVVFDASSLSSGIYFYQFVAETPADEAGQKARYVDIKKMLLMR